MAEPNHALPGTDACPMGPIRQARKDAWDYLYGQRRPQQGPGRHVPDDPFAELRNPGPPDSFVARGWRWRWVGRLAPTWIQAPDDVNYGWPRGQRDGRRLQYEPRHYHADLQVGDECLHVDLLATLSFGPVQGFHYIQVFAGGQTVARGGGWSLCYSGGSRNLPLVVERGDWLLRIDELDGHLHNHLECQGPPMDLWERVARRRRASPAQRMSPAGRTP